MKILLFRFEGDKIHYIEVIINWKDFIVWKKEKISLESSCGKWEKYKKVLDELLLLNTRYAPDLFSYHSPQKYRWRVLDTEWFAIGCVLNLFAFNQNRKILELTKPSVRETIWITQKAFDSKYESTKEFIIREYGISKSDIILEGLIFLFLVNPL